MKWTDKELGQKDCWNLWQDKLVSYKYKYTQRETEISGDRDRDSVVLGSNPTQANFL